MTKTQIKDVPNITDTEKRILTALSKSAYTIRELSFLLNISEPTIRVHLCNLSKKGLVLNTSFLENPRTKLYFYNESAKPS